MKNIVSLVLNKGKLDKLIHQLTACLQKNASLKQWTANKYVKGNQKLEQWSYLSTFSKLKKTIELFSISLPRTFTNICN